MEQQSIQTPSNPFYLDLLINTVNNDPTPKNILKMQQVMNQLMFDVGMQNQPLKEDGVIGAKTKGAVKWFRGFQEQEKQRKASMEQEQAYNKAMEGRAQYDKERMERFGKAEDRPSVFDLIKGNDSMDLRKELEKDK
jgi:lysozyme family protein